MDFVSIAGAVGGLIGVASGLYSFLFVKQDRASKQLANDSAVIEQYKQLAASQETERLRLLEKCNKKNDRIEALTAEVEKWRAKYDASRCDIKTCRFRRPPLECDTPQSEEETL